MADGWPPGRLEGRPQGHQERPPGAVIGREALFVCCNGIGKVHVRKRLSKVMTHAL